ncbi:MAG: DUF86 domain-containing protein [Candidatus Omnitrophica bacterium]|nr:DUF86 domain-containing protein [Candidatus Omnitrophota bacterium]MBU4457509.1 DUF86 domain-containing protein [Candidatus Omnitrophota bacterium]
MINYVNFNPKLEKLQEYVSYLKDYQAHTLKELKKDHTLQGAVLHYLQLAIECAFDIGELLISELRLRKPEEAREVINILGENKIIPDDFAKRFAPVAGFRNILVHEYADVDLNKVYNHLQNDLQDFDFYAKCIAKYIKSRNKM